MKNKFIDVEYFANYIATVERVKNTINGCPKYHVTVMDRNPQQTYGAAKVYTVIGYESNRGIAEKAIERFISGE